MTSDDEERMRADWREFVESSRSFEAFEPIEFVAEEPFAPSAKFRKTFPVLSELLEQAKSFAIEINADDPDVRERMILRSWNSADGETFGWLCYPPSPALAKREALADHRTLLKEFGSIREWCREQSDLCPDLSNAMGPTAPIEDAYVFELYETALGDAESPIELSEWRYLAYHGNGDAFIVHPETGEVLYLGYDVGLERAEPYGDGDTPVYQLEDVTDFRSWVELIAQQHLNALDS